MIKVNKDKEAYRSFCEESESFIPLFCQPWWLDVVCDAGEWEVVLAWNSGGDLTGVLPYYRTQYYGFPVIRMPMLTPFIGPLIFSAGDKKNAVASTRKIVQGLIEELPSAAYLLYNCHHSFTDWLPFYWAGYQQTTRYTNILDLRPGGDELQAGFKPALRNKIRKARRLVRIEHSDDLPAFYAINRQSFERQEMATPYSQSFLQRLDDALSSRGQRSIYLAYTPEGDIVAGAYIVRDERTAYCLALGAGEEGRRRAAVPLLLWSAIQDAAGVVPYFDFEGSMIEVVAKFFGSFGGKLVPYFQLYRGRNRFFDLLRLLTARRS